jgi:hypothetical protein
MKITCERKLGDEEKDVLVASAKLMDFMGWNDQWVGDGMLYRTTKEGEFHFVDQKYEEDET